MGRSPGVGVKWFARGCWCNPVRPAKHKYVVKNHYGANISKLPQIINKSQIEHVETHNYMSETPQPPLNLNYYNKQCHHRTWRVHNSKRVWLSRRTPGGCVRGVGWAWNWTTWLLWRWLIWWQSIWWWFIWWQSIWWWLIWWWLIWWQ